MTWEPNITPPTVAEMRSVLRQAAKSGSFIQSSNYDDIMRYVAKNLGCVVTERFGKADKKLLNTILSLVVGAQLAGIESGMRIVYKRLECRARRRGTK